MMLRDFCAAQYNQNDEYREFGHSETGFSIGIAYYNYRFVEEKKLEKNTVVKSESHKNNGKWELLYNLKRKRFECVCEEYIQ